MEMQALLQVSLSYFSFIHVYNPLCGFSLLPGHLGGSIEHCS
jgi:hypothetical protein